VNKTDRLTLIRSRFLTRHGVPLPGVMTASSVEISQAAALVRGTVAMVDSEEETAVNSNLIFDKAEVKADRETDILLTPAEKRQLVKVVLHQKVVEASEANEVVLPPADFEDYEPSYSPEIDRYARACAAFEMDCESRPLLLLG
jgi:hypothetical protein